MRHSSTPFRKRGMIELRMISYTNVNNHPQRRLYNTISHTISHVHVVYNINLCDAYPLSHIMHNFICCLKKKYQTIQIGYNKVFDVCLFQSSCFCVVSFHCWKSGASPLPMCTHHWGPCPCIHKTHLSVLCLDCLVIARLNSWNYVGQSCSGHCTSKSASACNGSIPWSSPCRKQ